MQKTKKTRWKKIGTTNNYTYITLVNNIFVENKEIDDLYKSPLFETTKDGNILDSSLSFIMHKKFDYNLFKQGQYLLKKKQYDKALNLFKRFAKLNIKNPDGFDAIGTAYYYIKDKNKACINWKNACKLGKCENFNKFKKIAYCKE